jgi:antitoxin component YwqK of YwqJK toxin-antitoxin module
MSMMTNSNRQVEYKRLVTYHDSGNIRSEEHYVNGELDGLARVWYDNDQHTHLSLSKIM